VRGLVNKWSVRTQTTAEDINQWSVRTQTMGYGTWIRVLVVCEATNHGGDLSFNTSTPATAGSLFGI
jgi:hypothetical protein